MARFLGTATRSALSTNVWIDVPLCFQRMGSRIARRLIHAGRSPTLFAAATMDRTERRQLLQRSSRTQASCPRLCCARLVNLSPYQGRPDPRRPCRAALIFRRSPSRSTQRGRRPLLSFMPPVISSVDAQGFEQRRERYGLIRTKPMSKQPGYLDASAGPLQKKFDAGLLRHGSL